MILMMEGHIAAGGRMGKRMATESAQVLRVKGNIPEHGILGLKYLESTHGQGKRRCWGYRLQCVKDSGLGLAIFQGYHLVDHQNN